MAGKKRPTKAKMGPDQAVALAEYAARTLIAAEKLRIKTKTVAQFPLDAVERATVADLPTLPAKIKKKPDGPFTVAEVASMLRASAESLPGTEPKLQASLLLVAERLMDCLQTTILLADPRAREIAADTVYQFKVTRLESDPRIWRRIQVKDCTLDELHEHIQTAMGLNSHLHLFKIGEHQYANPMYMEVDFEEFGYEDSTKTKISEILPKTRKRFRFKYEYIFGDSWYHDVLFEGVA
jgi:hypothetical protein